MSDRKTRSDSKLGTLPPERQEAIAEYARSHSVDETVAWLAADGLQTSSGAVSVWLSSWRLSRQLRLNESTVETLMADYRQRNPQASEAELRAMGQSFFSALAIQQQDAKVWAMTQSLDLKREQLSLDRKRFQRETAELFVKWSADQRARDIVNAAQPDAVKIEQLGKAMFGELWD
jgi:hypothetical protein